MWRAAFLPWPVAMVTVRSEGTMSPPANSPGTSVMRLSATCTTPSWLTRTPGMLSSTLKSTS
ncbi:hypothetical protein D3C85_1688730 [compost metagenome]